MKFLIADDHTLFRDSLTHYIQRAFDGVEVISTSNFNDAFDLIDSHSDLGLVMLDYKMPGMKGMKGLRKVRETYPNLRVVLMSGVAEEEQVHQAIALGARGYFPKTLSGKGLVDAIDLVLKGQQYIPRDPQTNAIMPAYYDDSEPKGKSKPAEMKPLTPREKEVLEYVSKGASNKEIANALGLQLVTVKLHVRGVCKKLGAKNRTQAALSAREMGLVSGE